MSKRIGMNVALGLNTGGFSQGLNKAKLDMDKFSKDIKRQNEVLAKFGMGGLGRSFGVAGTALEAISMGGIGGAAAGIGLPLAAAAGTIKFLEGVNQFRRDAIKHMEQYNRDIASNKIGQLITDQMSAFAILAAQQQAVAGPGAFETFKQGVASGIGGQGLLMRSKAVAGGMSEFANMVLENPLQMTPLGFLLGGGISRVGAGMSTGTAQDAGQAQAAAAALEEARRQTSILDRLVGMFGGN